MHIESWHQAMGRGFAASSYNSSSLPNGEWIGTLEAKIWGRSVNLICYFSNQNGQRYALSAFRTKRGVGAGKWYTAQDGLFDMKEEGLIGQQFLLTTGTNSRGNPAWKSVKPL